MYVYLFYDDCFNLSFLILMFSNEILLIAMEMSINMCVVCSFGTLLKIEMISVFMRERC